MSSYITNTRPSIFQRCLNKLGLIELPIRVNCWYCCQDSFILPGSKNTVNHWYCHLCESVNARDKNGDVIDPTPFETYTPTNARNSAPPPSRSQPLKSIRDTSRTLCSSCQQNQRLIYQLLSDYIPDENDPTYDYKCKTVYNYKAELHKRYQLCHDCQAKIIQLVEEQKAALRARNLSDALTKSMTTEVRKRPNKYQFYTKGVCWTSIHLVTILVVNYCIIHSPVIDLPFSTSLSDYLRDTFVYRKNLVMDILFNRDDLIKNLIHYLRSASQLCINFFKKSIFCMVDYDDTRCSFPTSYAWVEIAVLFNLLTYGWIEWHAFERTVFNDNRRLTHWELYTKSQFILWLFRFLLIGCIMYNLDTPIFAALLVIYVLLLLVPYFLVQPSKGKWPLSMVGVSHSSFMFEEDSSHSEGSSSHHSSNKSTTANKRRGFFQRASRAWSKESVETDDPMMADDMSIVQEEPTTEQQQQQQQQQPSYFQFRQPDADILDNIVSGFNNIRM